MTLACSTPAKYADASASEFSAERALTPTSSWGVAIKIERIDDGAKEQFSALLIDELLCKRGGVGRGERQVGS
jgi:hypothetical protein